MKTVKSKQVVVFAIFLALAAVAFSLLSDGQRSIENDASSAAPSSLDSANESVDAVRSQAMRPFINVANQAASRETSSALLQALGTSLSENAVSALDSEIDMRFADFLANLAGTPQRKEVIRQEIAAAYSDILAFGVALQRGDISPAEAEAHRDPNYVLNQLASVLTSEELTELETEMETEARQRFQSTYAPQLEVIGVELTEAGQETLLETLFTETYLLINRNGLGTAANLNSGFQLQLDAIENARDSLRVSMTPAEFEQAEAFLSEQERGLLGAQTIFSNN